MHSLDLPNEWSPRWYQIPAWNAWACGTRRSLLIWHRRAGKDDLALHKAAVAAHRRVANYWHCLPQYEQARKAIWEAINPHTGKRRIDEAFPRAIRRRTDHSSMMIEFTNGSIWKVVGSDNPDSLVGAPPAGIVFSEWALSNPAAWAYLAPILAENDGWADFITTPRGRNHVASMLDMARANPAWFKQVLTVDDTKVIAREVIEAQRGEYHSIYGTDAGDALIEQEYWCSFAAAILGAYWGKEINAAERDGRVGRVDVDRNHPVHTAWDIGVDDPMAIWCFQVGPGVLNVVDYYESSGHGFDHYTAWLDERGYNGTDWVPHDARMREVGAPGGRTRIETLIALGRKPRLVPDHKLMDGVNAGRKTIPLAKFDADRCAKGLDCLREYKAEWDDNARTFRKTPLHNWASHGADAWRHLSVAWSYPHGKPKHGTKAKLRGVEHVTVNELIKLAYPKRLRV